MQIPETVDAVDLAALLGINRRNVLDWANRGVLVRAEKRGQYRTLESIHAYAAALIDVAARREENSGAGLPAERTKLTRVNRELAEVKLAQLQAETITREEAGAAWAAFATTVRRSLRSLPSAAREAVPALTAHDEAKLRKMVSDKLADLATEAASIAIAADPGELVR